MTLRVIVTVAIVCLAGIIAYSAIVTVGERHAAIENHQTEVVQHH
jgi:hypothetical protein